MSKEVKEKVLTEKEKERLELFEKKVQELTEQGYTKKDMMISNIAANVGSLVVTLPFVILYMVIYFLVNGIASFDIEVFSLRNIILVYLIFIVLIVVHELLHGMTWKFFVKDRKYISFGFNKAALAPYCTCSMPLTKAQYIIGALMPTLILGFLLGAIAIAAGNTMLIILACFMFIGGGGDFLMIINLLKNKVDSKDILYYDHPTEIGSVMFYR